MGWMSLRQIQITYNKILNLETWIPRSLSPQHPLDPRKSTQGRLERSVEPMNFSYNTDIWAPLQANVIMTFGLDLGL